MDRDGRLVGIISRSDFVARGGGPLEAEQPPRLDADDRLEGRMAM